MQPMNTAKIQADLKQIDPTSCVSIETVNGHLLTFNVLMTADEPDRPAARSAAIEVLVRNGIDESRCEVHFSEP